MIYIRTPNPPHSPPHVIYICTAWSHTTEHIGSSDPLPPVAHNSASDWLVWVRDASHRHGWWFDSAMYKKWAPRWLLAVSNHNSVVDMQPDVISHRVNDLGYDFDQETGVVCLRSPSGFSSPYSRQRQRWLLEINALWKLKQSIINAGIYAYCIPKVLFYFLNYDTWTYVMYIHK